MHTDNPPRGEMRFVPVREGRYRVIVLDQHKRLHEHAGDSLEELNEWLLTDEEPIGSWLDPEGVEHVQDLLDQHGACQVRTGFDADLVFVKGGAPRG
jgi:hypothetical protein